MTIHGEEPASAHAAANKIDFIGDLPKLGIPAAAVFVANPGGYFDDKRYFNVRRNRFFGRSVGDPDHVLPTKLFPNVPIPRRLSPSSEAAKALTAWSMERSLIRKPRLVMDHHEDEIKENKLFNPKDWNFFYGYAYGESEIIDAICPILTNILEKSGYAMQKDGQTRFGEEIVNGFVKNNDDGSLDFFMSQSKYIDRFQIKSKPAAVATFVLETVINYIKPQTIEERSKIHELIIENYPHIWETVKTLSSKNRGK